MDAVIATPTRELAFSSPLIDCRVADARRDHHLRAPVIVVNPGPTPVSIHATPRQTVPPFASELLMDATISADHPILLVRVIQDEGLKHAASWPGWRHLSQALDSADPIVAATHLWRSERDCFGVFQRAPHLVEPQAFDLHAARRYRMTANLWFAPAGTDCLIHNRHDFLEFHVQLHGIGHMQKFSRNDRATQFSDTRLSPGASHPIYECARDPAGGYLYPWHQYHAETDCIWLVVEYAPIFPESEA